MKRTTLNFKKSALAICLCAASTLAMPSAATGGATEWTQIANHIELLFSVSKQTAMVSEQIASKVQLIRQYQTMLTNLKNLPQNLMDEALAPYQESLAALNELRGSVQDLRGAADSARTVFEGRGMDFRSSGMDLRKYMKYESALANQRGGMYRKRMDQDIAAMDALRDKSTALRRVSQRTAAITGNLEGLQQLGQLSSMATGELMEIKSVLLAQSADKNADKAAVEETNATKASMVESSVKTGRTRVSRDDGKSYGIGDPQQTWRSLDIPR